jgi:hypothetical protein
MNCTVTLEHSGQQFAGSSPTAAAVAAALAQGSNQYVNGFKAFGLDHPAVQCKLQRDSAKASAGSSVSTATDTGHEVVVEMAAGSSPAAEVDGQVAHSPLAAEYGSHATKQPQAEERLPVVGSPATAAPASSAIALALSGAAADAADAAPQARTPSVLVQTSALPPLQLRQQAAPQPPTQHTLQQRVIQTGATLASPREASTAATVANTGSRSPLPPIATGQTPSPRTHATGPATPAAKPAPSPPPRVRAPLSARAPLGLFKPSPVRGSAAPLPTVKGADQPGGAAQPAADLAQFAAQRLHSSSGGPEPSAEAASSAFSPSAGLKPGQSGGSGAFSRFNAASHVPAAALTGRQQQASTLSPFMAARSLVPPASLAASAAASAALFGYPGLSQLNAPSWSGSNVSCSSMLGPGAFNGGGSTHAGSMDGSSFDLRSLSNNSVGSLSSWAPLQRLSAGSTDALRDYFGPFAANSSRPWDPCNYSAAALAQFAHTARLSGSSKGSASLRAVAAAAVDAAKLSETGRASASDAAAAGPLAKKQRRTAPAVWPPIDAELAAERGNAEDAPERQPSPQGRLTPEALSQGAAAAEAALSSQGLLNPSAATVKAPRVAAKGWTAFTAFGLHTRDAVRGANPGATSVEVEKLVGQLWGRLSKDEKQGWVQRAARARSARGSSGASSGQPRQKRKRLPAEAPEGAAAPAEAAGADPSAVHRCKRSSRVRRPPIRTLSSGELAPASASPRGGPVRSAPAAGALQATASQAAAELELEVGTLEVLASMQAAAADSHRGPCA